jgi:hypothetical protein
MRGHNGLHINWVHLGVLAFCIAAWIIFAAASVRVSESSRVHRLLDRLSETAQPFSRGA